MNMFRIKSDSYFRPNRYNWFKHAIMWRCMWKLEKTINNKQNKMSNSHIWRFSRIMLKSVITSYWMNYFKGRDSAMQFGMPTMIETKSIESYALLCHELGLDFVELNMNIPEYQAERLDLLKEGGYICETNRK